MRGFKTVFCAFFLTFSAAAANAQVNGQPLYKDPSASVNERVRDLLQRMTLKEKIAQLSHLHGHQLYSGQELDLEKLEEAAGDAGYGCVEGFTLAGQNCGRAMYAIQKYMVEKTRLGIPILTVTESLHGSVQDGSTIFPQSVAIGSTFNTELAYRMAAMISGELKAQGMRQTLSPGMDVVRELRWGRVEEAFGEDPWLVGQMGIAQVRGYLDNGISPMLKPFGAGGAPRGGLNLASVACGERDLREIYLKPYEMVVRSTGVMAVMSSYNSWNNVPNSSSRFLLTDILRNEWGFDGYVYSDWGAVTMLRTFHHTAKDDAEAARQALLAGIDLEAASNCYRELEGLVLNKQLDEKYIDLAVERVLKVKFRLGLFEDPYPDTSGYRQKVHSPQAVKLSRRIADEAIVLLKNDRNLLPLNIEKINSIAVIGPNADQVQFGDYTWSRSNEDGITPLRGIKELLKDEVVIHYAKGCDLTTDDRSGFKEAVDAAEKSDISIVFVGSASASLARDYSNATSGEGFDLSSLELTGVQEEMIKAVHAAGKPVVVVLVTGKPFAIPWLKQHIPSIVVQWYGGERAGAAIAGMLFGKTNPSAKLPFSFPQSVGHLPVYYNHLPTDKGYYRSPGAPNDPGRDYVFSSPSPLWAFGHGLSYTIFDYLDAELPDTVLSATDTLEVTVRIRNSGRRDGKEVVQLYVRDLVGSVVTPVKQLKGFAKPFIEAGATAEVVLKLPVSELALYDLNMEKVVEPGDFEIQIGSASDKIYFNELITVVDPGQSSAREKVMNDERTEHPKKNDDASGKYEDASGKFEDASGKIITISGEIRDVQATPLAGVKVRAAGSGKESMTSANGKYLIRAFTNDTLRFSAPGYEGMTMRVEGKENINVRLDRSQN